MSLITLDRPDFSGSVLNCIIDSFQICQAVLTKSRYFVHGKTQVPC